MAEASDPQESDIPADETPEPEHREPAALPEDEEEEGAGVSIRSRPPIFYFWPTLTAALWFMAFLGLQDEPIGAEQAPVQAAAEDAAGAAEATETAAEASSSQADGFIIGVLRFIPPLPRSMSLVIVAIVTLLMVAYLIGHLIFNVSSSRAIETLDRTFSRPLFLRTSAMDLFFWVLVVFVLLSPGYGLLAFLAFHAFGLMTDHKMFTHPPMLRRRLFWVIGAIVVAVLLGVLRGGPDTQTLYEYDQDPMVGAIFFVMLAFNLFVLAFDFNGANLVALVMSLAGVVAILALLNTFHPGVGAYFQSLAQASYGLRLNSNFYQFYAYLMSLLMVFSGLIAKADFWRITPLAIIHYQGLLVQRNRHYGALVNFHYHVEFPDFFESMLGGWAGDFILSLPREDRPELVKDVWYARYYNQRIRQLLERVDLGGD